MDLKSKAHSILAGSPFKTLASIIGLVVLISGTTLTTTYAFDAKYESIVSAQQREDTLMEFIHQKEKDKLREEINYLSDKRVDGDITKPEVKRLERYKRKLDEMIRGGH